MESSFNVILFPVDYFVAYWAVTINNEENITVSIASRIFYTPSIAGTELCLDYILSLSVYIYIYIYMYMYIYMCVCVCVCARARALVFLVL